MQSIIKVVFTAFVVALIVLPLPPSTIIGLVIANHPKTNKYMIPQAVTASSFLVKGVGVVIMWKVNAISNARQRSAVNWIQTWTALI